MTKTNRLLIFTVTVLTLVTLAIVVGSYVVRLQQ
jgi:hypothetical protein